MGSGSSTLVANPSSNSASAPAPAATNATISTIGFPLDSHHQNNIQETSLSPFETDLFGLQAAGKAASLVPSKASDGRGSTSVRVKASDALSLSASLITGASAVDKQVPFAPTGPQPLDMSLSCMSLHIEPSIGRKQEAERIASAGCVSADPSSMESSFVAPQPLLL